MSPNPRRRSQHLSARLIPLLARAGTCIGLAATFGASPALGGSQVVWVARGSSEHTWLREPFSSQLSFGSIIAPTLGPTNGPEVSNGTYVYSNWMIPSTPGASTGVFPPSTFETAAQMDHAVIGDDVHANRRIDFSDDTLPPQSVAPYVLFESLRITTHGDLTIVGGYVGPLEWLIRDPGCTGNHVISTRVLLAPNGWIGGSGSLTLDVIADYINGSLPETFTKSGPGLLILNPGPTRYRDGRSSLRGFNVYDGTLALRGTGAPYLFGTEISDVLRIGAAYGGLDYPPDSVPPVIWSPITISPVPPVKSPRALIQADNIVPPGGIVRMHDNSTLQFEAPEPISFLGNIVREGFGTRSVVVKAEVLESVTFATTSLDDYAGNFRIERGVARLQGAPNGFVNFSLLAPSFPYEAVLELKTPAASYSFSNPVSGFGRVVKSGPSTLTFGSDTSNFSGDFVVAEGTLATPSSAPAPILRNAVTIDGPASILNQQASNALADNTIVSLEDSGRWQLNGKSDTIARLKLVSNARVELGGGTLTLADGKLDIVHTPGASTSATIQGPGTLSSITPLTIDSFSSLAANALDIQATLNAPSVLLTGVGTVRLGGSGASGPAITVQGGELRLRRTNVAASAGAITIGDASSGLPFTPSASVVLEASDQLPDNRAVTMNRQASLNLNGFTDTIGGLVVNGAGPFTVDAAAGELVLTGDASFTGTGTTTITGPMNMLAGTRAFTVNTGSTAVLSGPMYSGTMNKLGAGTLLLSALDGSFTLNNSGFSTIATTASLGGLTGNGSVRIDGSLTLSPPAAAQRAYSGALSGVGMFIKSGTGMQELNAGFANTYAGGTRIEGGTLFLNRFPGTTVIPGNLTIASGGTLLYAGGAINQIADTADITIESGGTMDLAGQSDTVRNLTITGTCRTDTANGSALGAITASQNIAVVAGTLDGAVGGGALSINAAGRAHIRGTVSSASLGLAGSTLAVGGFPGLDQLTITGAFATPNPNAVIECTVGNAIDPALIRALGSFSYPLFGTTTVRVIQNSPAPFGTSFRLIDFGTGSSSPNLSKYTLASVPGSGRGRLVLSNRVLSYVVAQNPCPADANGNGIQDIDDIFVFLNIWFAGSPGADFDLSGTQTIDDIFIFINAWFRAC